MKIEDVSIHCRISPEVIHYFIQESWIIPIDPEELIFDAEDIARIKFIHELREIFAVNDEAVPIILHLVDQLNLINLKFRED